MDLDEVWESPAFWILGGLGIIAELMGYIASKRMGWTVMPFWQLIVMMIGTLVAAAFFGTKD